MEKEKFKKIIDLCSSLEEIKKEVYENHDDNKWWPLKIKDYKKRLIISGLSTRISYNMINTYQKVIYKLDSFSFEEIMNLSDKELEEIIKPLGLIKYRIKYIRSMIDFINKYEKDIINLTNEELIELIAKEVKGASYKVGQCCTLYSRGYYCGVIPVDSGMKDVQLPCIGFEELKGDIAHKKYSEQLKELIKETDLEEILIKNGYEDLNIEEIENPTWVIHLILIYYKRIFCNKKKCENCVLYINNLASGKCKKDKEIR